MTRMEELELRKSKLNDFYNSLKDEEINTVDLHDGFSVERTPLAKVVSEEYHKIETEIARLRMEEYLNIDKNFEQEVLK